MYWERQEPGSQLCWLRKAYAFSTDMQVLNIACKIMMELFTRKRLTSQE